MSFWFLLLIGAVSIVAGATASVVGFGIGSLITPVLAWRFGPGVAVAAVALPHFAGSVIRGWRLRQFIDRELLLRFGVLSATGGLIGALAFARFAPDVLGRVLGALLLLTAAAGITEWSKRWKPRGAVIWILGALSGFFGGVVGNQGGLRAAALATFDLRPAVFVATSTVIGVVIDLVRSPIYLARTASDLIAIWQLIVIAVCGVVAGTLFGERLLFGMSTERFRRIVSIAIGFLGIWFLLHPG